MVHLIFAVHVISRVYLPFHIQGLLGKLPVFLCFIAVVACPFFHCPGF